ncbi:MAG: class I SAM-dependent methyltransferase [Chloroflexi bacterium]|nr:class I SAM-dependent methyltransferase [Chloroflexota bacterium]
MLPTTPIDYDSWAEKYDSTRGASPSVLRPVLEALGLPGSRLLLDIGGGTGNYALAFREAGFTVALVDHSPGIARRAAGKLGAGAVAVGDAQRLPFRDGAADCAVAINVLRHLPQWPLLLREGRRIVHEGPFVIKDLTHESVRASWVQEYFPSALQRRSQFQPEQIVAAMEEAGFSRVETRRFVYEDDADGSFQAMMRFPEALLDEARAMNTGFIQRLPREEREAGLAAIRRDHRSGRLREVIARYEPLMREYGDSVLFVGYP